MPASLLSESSEFEPPYTNTGSRPGREKVVGAWVYLVYLAFMAMAHWGRGKPPLHQLPCHEACQPYCILRGDVILFGNHYWLL